MRNNGFLHFLKGLFRSKAAFNEMPMLINYQRLLQLAEQRRQSYLGNSPFPHIVIDDFLEPEILEKTISSFPSQDDLKWVAREALSESGRVAQAKKLEFALGKKEIDIEMQLAPILRYLLLEFNSGTFLYFLKTLTAMPGLISDPKMHGGGLHQTLSGGMLRVHADFYKHPIYQLDRRLNVLLFLNKDWRKSYGGNLELWSADMSRCEREIEPIANRCVIFNTTQTSYHGYTKPITCPPNVSRKSLAMYYYTVPGIGLSTVDPPTHWQNLPGED